MLVSPQDISPSQDFLKQGTVNFIFTCIKNNELDKLPPAPIVRRDAQGQLVAIDGHNLIAVKHFLGEDIEVHIAESADDRIMGNTKAYNLRNHELKDKFEKVLIDRVEVYARGIKTFNDLISLHKDIFRNIRRN
ncbi:MAG: hypothetical protein M3Q36_01840 [bacterium]|nr:hypothetical protein [bacterium]